MEQLRADPPFYSYEPDLSYRMQGQVVPSHALEPYDNVSALGYPALNTTPTPEELGSAHNTLHSFDSPPPDRSQPHNFQSSTGSDVRNTSTSSMGPPTITRKRKAQTLHDEDWEPYKARVIELHIERNLPLPKVKKIMENESGLIAEVRQYRRRISKWHLDKNIKPKEMKAIVRKQQQRKVVETNKGELSFMVRGNIVEPKKVNRWMKRNKIPESILYVPSPAASTPSTVCCRTVSERGSPAPSPRYLTPAPAAQSLQLSSPVLSVSSIIRPATSTFTGHSPAPAYLILPQEGTGQVLAGSVQYRYRQTDEDSLRWELSTLEILHGKNHPETLRTLSELGQILIDQGRYSSAEEIFRGLVKARQNRNGDHDINTLEALELLGQLLGFQGFYLKAEKLHRGTFESRRTILGLEHPDTLASMGNLASMLCDQGRYKEAEELEVQVIEMGKSVMGHEHPSTLTSMANLASTLRKQGRWKEAEKLGVQVMEMRTRVLGHEHPSTLTSMANLAATFRREGRWKEAEELVLQVTETRMRVLGHEHPDTLMSMANLVSTLRKKGRWKKAEKLGVQVMEIRKRVLGHEHPSTLMSMANLAATFLGQGRWKKAEKLGLQVMEMRKRVLGHEHPSTLMSMANLALTYSNQGRWKEAEKLGLQVTEMRKMVLGHEHPDTLISARMWRKQGGTQEREPGDQCHAGTCYTISGARDDE